MDSDKTLAQRIAALAEESPEFVGQARVLKGEDPLLAIFEEVDTTVLAASLMFETEDSRMCLQVAGRRLQRVSEASGDVNAPDTLVGVPLTPEDTDLVEQIAELIAAFAADAPPLQVTPTQLDDADTDGGGGLSTAVLARALELDDADVPGPERFNRRAGKVAAATMRLEGGQIAETSGSTALLATLRITLSTQVQAFLAARAKECPDHTDPSLTYFDDVVEPGMGLALAVFGDTMFLMALERSFLGLVQEAFARAT